MLIDVVGAFAHDANEELRSRHTRYGLKVKELSANRVNHLLVLSKSNYPFGYVIDDRDGLRVQSIGSSSNLWTLGRNAAKVVRESRLPITWIAGSPFREAVACRSAHRLVPGHLQIQAHGDFGNLSLFSGNLKSRIRYLLARNSFGSADSIRAVAPRQLEALQATFQISRKKCFVAPVPVNQSFFITARQEGPLESPSKVGFFGRIHEERGLSLWVQVASELHRFDPGLEFHIIGDGPEALPFKKNLASNIPPDKMHFHGSLSGDQLVNCVKELSLVLNTCSGEAYGRSTVESLALGVPVISVISPGSTFIKESVSPKHLYLIEALQLTLMAQSVISTHKAGLDLNFLRNLQAFELSNIEQTARSWI